MDAFCCLAPENEPHARTELLSALLFTCNLAEGRRCGAFRMGDWKYIQLKRVKRREGWSAPDFNPATTLSSDLEMPNHNASVSFNISCTPHTLVRPANECIDAPCLFNVRDDPCENFDRREDEPEIFETVRARFHEIADKYADVRVMGTRSSPGCVGVTNGAWGLWQDDDSGACEPTSGVDRFDLATSLRPLHAADELSPGNSEHQCAAQCLAADGCLGFRYVPNLILAGTNQWAGEDPLSQAWHWSGAPIGVCHLYRQNFQIGDMQPDMQTTGYYSMLGCEAECTANVLEQFTRVEQKRPKHSSNTLESTQDLTVDQCANFCLTTYGCLSFTHLVRTEAQDKCQLYERAYKERFLVPHPAKVYHAKQGECLESCPLSIMDRFVLVPNSRPVRLPCSLLHALRWLDKGAGVGVGAVASAVFDKVDVGCENSNHSSPFLCKLIADPFHRNTRRRTP